MGDGRGVSGTIVAEREAARRHNQPGASTQGVVEDPVADGHASVRVALRWPAFCDFPEAIVQTLPNHHVVPRLAASGHPPGIAKPHQLEHGPQIGTSIPGLPQLGVRQELGRHRGGEHALVGADKPLTIMTQDAANAGRAVNGGDGPSVADFQAFEVQQNDPKRGA